MGKKKSKKLQGTWTEYKISRRETKIKSQFDRDKNMEKQSDNYMVGGGREGFNSQNQ